MTLLSIAVEAADKTKQPKPSHGYPRAKGQVFARLPGPAPAPSGTGGLPTPSISIRPGTGNASKGNRGKQGPSYSGSSTRNTTPVLFEGTEPGAAGRGVGYNSVYCSKGSNLNVPTKNYSPNFSDSSSNSNGGPRNKLIIPDVDETRPPSPRDIARAFEAAAKATENERAVLSGRNRPGCLSPYKSPNSQKNLPSPTSANGRGVASEPEVINPLHEFTNMANKRAYEQDGGQYNFQARLRKTSGGAGGGGAQNSRNDGGAGGGHGNRRSSLRRESTSEEDKRALTADSPDLTSPVHKITLSPGFVIEGVCEDL